MEDSAKPASRMKNQPEVSFRKYQPGDIPACARLAREAWPAGSAVGQDYSEQSGMEGYMEYSLEVSNYSDIALISGTLVGFLFGRIDGYPGTPLPRWQMFGELPSIIRSSFGRRSGIIRGLGFLWSLVLTELKLGLKTPWSDGAIEMFIVDSRMRGKGIGSILLERYLAAARDSGCRLVTVYTDDLMSDWEFYERRGFRRVGTFHDNITSHYSGARATGIIYLLELRPQEADGRGTAATKH